MKSLKNLFLRPTPKPKIKNNNTILDLFQSISQSIGKKAVQKSGADEIAKIEIPKCLQDLIPVSKIFEDGIFLADGKYSKSYCFSDINYYVSSENLQEKYFEQYQEILNSAGVETSYKISIFNQPDTEQNFSYQLELQGDKYDIYRKECNKYFSDIAKDAENMIQKKYITVSIKKNNINEARNAFSRIGAMLNSLFGGLESSLSELSLNERLRIIYEFYHEDSSGFHFDINEKAKNGSDFRDYICPSDFDNNRGYIYSDGKYSRSLILSEYANRITDELICELCEANNNIKLSMDFEPLDTSEAILMIQKILFGIESNITNWQKKQTSANNFTATIPYEMELQRDEVKEMLDNITSKDQRIFFGLVTIVHSAKTLEELDRDTEALISVAKSHLCTLISATFQQLDAINTTLLYGIRRIDAYHTLTTENAAILMPFRAQDIVQKDGICIGKHSITKNIICADRTKLQNGNGMIVGVPGSGKSFFAKLQIIISFLKYVNADIIIIDPEREYSDIVNALGGSVVDISAGSENHINAMDLSSNDFSSNDNPLSLKSDLVLSLCEQICGSLGAAQKSIIDRCIPQLYKDYIASNCTINPPTLAEFYDILKSQPESQAQDIALALELFVKGSLNTFAHQSNIKLDNNRLICFDIHELGKQLQTVGMIIVLDSLLGRIQRNRAIGRNTYVIIDELSIILRHSYTAQFTDKLWKIIRKYGGVATGILQNIDEAVRNDVSRTMVANSEFMVMLNQSGTDREQLEQLFKLSEMQLHFIDNADVGHGLVKIGKTIIPFYSEFPKDTNLYKLISTNFNEKKI